MSSEFSFIDSIKRRSSTRHLEVGIGDDCAVFVPLKGCEVLTTTDMLVESIHFNLAWTSLYQLGRKSLSVSLSDIAAMGGTPKRAYLSVAFPVEWADEKREEFISGFISCADEYDVTLAGGDTCASAGGFVVSVTVEGEVPQGGRILRAGASSGDRLFVTGTLGDSALALSQLQQGVVSEATLLNRHHNPTARVSCGEWLQQQGFASSMIDISDGLLADLRHIVTASKCGAIIQLCHLPLSRSFSDHYQHDSSVLKFALSGGEDYELLFTVPEERVVEMKRSLPAGINVTEIGNMTTEDDSIMCLDSTGKHVNVCVEGFDHFARESH